MRRPTIAVGLPPYERDPVLEELTNAEFGSVILVAGNIPFHTQLASVYIFGQVESDDPIGAAAVSVVLLVISLVVLLAIAFLGRWGSRHER